ncbi:MAG: glutathione peroxidase [Muribaculaceae bacterium]|nr:glutathione peroxidase [Muribaculaceae bacterium]
MATIYDFKALTSRGEELDLAQFRGKTLLIVNTASKCGFTPQFAGLEELHRKYKDRGLVVLGFPCNQFLNQDPGSDEEISGFCQLNYGVSFRIMKKIDVNGKNAHPVFRYLKKATGGLLGGPIKWNFTKFLISPDGSQVKRFAPITDPAKLVPDIEKFLAANE